MSKPSDTHVPIPQATAAARLKNVRQDKGRWVGQIEGLNTFVHGASPDELQREANAVVKAYINSFFLDERGKEITDTVLRCQADQKLRDELIKRGMYAVEVAG